MQERNHGLTITRLITAIIMSATCAAMPMAASAQSRIDAKSGQLVVDGQPFLVLGGELHNSSASSPDYMAPIWDQLASNAVGTVLGTASWDLVEPVEGQFDFTAVDDQIRQARSKGIKLALIWFGAYKNAESTFAPSWVRRDEQRFPRGLRDPGYKPVGIAAAIKGPILSVFNDRLIEADSRAFAAMMRHVREVDKARTVILVQVENEVGLLGSPRDVSPLANAAWAAPVPAPLIAYLAANRTHLRPELAEAWARGGNRQGGTWTEVFGSDAIASEIFMAWHFGSYVDRIARAGKAQLDVPMFTNAWLGPQERAPGPGDYPSGGPVARMLDVWKAAAPSLALLAPDIYIDDFAGVLEQYHRPDNPIFVPEARIDAGNLFVALGRYKAIGFSPFGIEDGKPGDPLFEACRTLVGMTEVIAHAQAEGRIDGFKIVGDGQEQVKLGGYTIALSHPRSTKGLFGAGTGQDAQAQQSGYGLVINSGPDEFLIVGRGIAPRFASEGATVELDQVQEGRFEGGKWRAGRTLNGDERFFLFPADSLRVLRIRLLKRPGP